MLKWVKSRARDLEVKESDLRTSMCSEVARVYEGRKFLLLSELLHHIGHEDTALVSDLVNGMRITGNAEPSGVFPPEFKPAQLEEADLWRVAKFAQAEVQERVPKHVLGKQVRVGGEERDMAEMAWDATLKEVRKGWLEGPFSAEEVTQKLGPQWTRAGGLGYFKEGKLGTLMTCLSSRSTGRMAPRRSWIWEE